jgi:hypothetical protein
MGKLDVVVAGRIAFDDQEIAHLVCLSSKCRGYLGDRIDTSIAPCAPAHFAATSVRLGYLVDSNGVFEPEPLPLDLDDSSFFSATATTSLVALASELSIASGLKSVQDRARSGAPRR